ncbi:MAG: hypothetical protein EXR79_00385 [Myxococcales bacterium]|nr:hypothetical protein [Myxococcales bacterium]
MPAELRRRLGQWRARRISEAELAQRTERWFWWRAFGLLLAWAVIGSLGVMQVRRQSGGIRTAYELVRATEALREQVEANRHAEAKLTGLKNPSELRREALDVYQMRVPGADEQVAVD